jgi:hypothetical protein
MPRVPWLAIAAALLVSTLRPASSALEEIGAVFVAQIVPATMVAGQAYAVSVTLRNTGSRTWSRSGPGWFRLGSHLPQDNATWGAARVDLAPGDNIATGEQKTFSFNVTAPATLGTYDFQWQMLEEGVIWFGAVSPPVAVTVTVTAPARGAEFVAQSVPATMLAGQTYTVSLTMGNTGNQTWSSTGPGWFRLGSHRPQDNATWGAARVDLAPGDNIANGEQKTFSFNVKTPLTLGTYDFQWQMLEEGVIWFGAVSPPVTVTVTAPTARGAEFVAQSVPATMLVGQTYPVSLTVRNRGSRTWSGTGPGWFRLGSHSPQDNVTWGLARADLAFGDNIATGQEKTFSFNVTAPVTLGMYDFHWQMLEEGVIWFGAVSPPVAVTVTAPARGAEFVAQSVPATMVAGHVYAVSVTWRNTGSQTWSGTQGSWFRLGSQGPEDNAAWGLARADLAFGDNIASGEQKTFSFNVTAPVALGTYDFQWRMLEEGVSWFGAVSPPVTVSVTAPARGAEFVAHSVPATMVAGQVYAVSLTMRNTGSQTWSGAAGGWFRLGSQGPEDNLTWGLARADLAFADNIAIGEQKTFSLNITAPVTLGTYDFQWQMLEEGVSWFGAVSPAAPVTVYDAIAVTFSASVTSTSGLRFVTAFGDVNEDNAQETFLSRNDGAGALQLLSPEDLGLAAIFGTNRVNRDARLVDFNGDGHLDLISTTYSPITNPESIALLFLGTGDGTFVEDPSFRSKAIGGFGETIVAADFDNDGDVDIFLPYYTFHSVEEQSYLFMNDGQGQFTDIADQAGVALRNVPEAVRPEGAQGVDFNGDGWIDLYVAGHLFMNGGDGTFTDVIASLQGPAGWFEEGAKFLDWNNDGHLDLLVNDFGQWLGPTLFEFDGAVFHQRAVFPFEPYENPFGINVYDMNNDGLEDVIVDGGVLCNTILFLNTGVGFVRTPVPQLAPLCQGIGAFAFADLNADGLIDMARVIRQSAAGPPDAGGLDFGVFTNDTQTPHGSFSIEVLGPNGERNQYGRVARASPISENGVIYTRVVDGGSGYLSQNQYALLIGTPFIEDHIVQVVYAGYQVGFTIAPGQAARVHADGRVFIGNYGAPPDTFVITAATVQPLSPNVTIPGK